MFRFYFFTVVLMLIASTSRAEGDLSCSIDTLPIQIMDGTAIQESKRHGYMTTLSTLEESGTRLLFRNFVTTVTKHIAARLDKEKLCMDSPESKRQTLLRFMYWQIGVRESMHDASLSILDVQPSEGCRISSPWIDIVFQRRPVPWIRGVIRWNERQLLADQAVLAGLPNVPLGVAMPFKLSELSQLAGDYAGSEILHKPAIKPVEERIPPDLLWLYRRSTQSTRWLFGGREALDIAMEKRAVHYTNLVTTLIDRCFASVGTDIRYNSILDVEDLISLEQYKIDSPLR